MFIRGEDVADGLRDWIKAELKEGPRQLYDLGKFFFTVSVGTIGAIATIEKFNQSSKMDTPMVCSLSILFISILISLNMARPKVLIKKVGGDTDLLIEYENQIKRINIYGLTWFIVWLIGTVFGIAAVYK